MINLALLQYVSCWRKTVGLLLALTCCGLDPLSFPPEALPGAETFTLRKRAVKKLDACACLLWRLVGFARTESGGCLPPALVLSPALCSPAGDQTVQEVQF
ncbi:hypothetical protein [Reticulibacter mediterranei]|uniref:hypothetical protein n=1 Tax=Reticulibacter mediterranei TaxID=2778369 RepID=UPI001C68BA0C|nr:hypothetical protein [Reticulibacter mediterranei]